MNAQTSRHRVATNNALHTMSTINLSDLLASVPVQTTRATPASTPALPSITPTRDRSLVALTATPSTRAHARSLFTDMRSRPVITSSITTASITNAKRYTCLVTLDAPSVSNALLDAPANDRLFTLTFAKRANDDVASCADFSTPATARLISALLITTAHLHNVRVIEHAIDSQRFATDNAPLLCPNTACASSVLCAYAVCVRPACDALTLSLLVALHNAMSIPLPSLPCDVDALDLTASPSASTASPKRARKTRSRNN